jgi:DNA invertase Pin-like site-specific DNA recombinase
MTKAARRLRLIGYVRVSRVAGREGDSFISPEEQEARIHKVAGHGNHEIIDVLVELDQSGGKMDRPLLEEALRRCEAGEADGIAVAALDRFARSVAGAAMALQRLDAANAELLSDRERLDTSTPFGRFARTIMLAMAELELERIRDSWRASTERAIGRGVHIGRPPFGYRQGAGGRLEPDPAKADVLRALFERAAAGDSWRTLQAMMNEQHPRDDSRSWSVSTLASMVVRRTYLGEAFHADVVNPRAHEPLVDRGTWEAANRPRSAGQARKERSPALLAGIAVCSTCGGRLTRTSEGRRGYLRYQCQQRRNGGGCSKPVRISLPALDQFVLGEVIRRLAASPAVEATIVEHAANLNRLEHELQLAEEELSAYLTLDLVSVVGAAAFQTGAEERAGALETAKQALAAARRQTLQHQRVTLIESLGDATVDEQRETLRALVERVDVAPAARPGKGSPVASRALVVLHGDEGARVAATKDLPERDRRAA